MIEMIQARTQRPDSSSKEDREFCDRLGHVASSPFKQFPCDLGHHRVVAHPVDGHYHAAFPRMGGAQCVCKNFCTGYVDQNEAIVMNARMVRKNYMTGFFATDFCSSIPLDLILKWAGVDSVDGTVTGTKQSLKMLKLLRMAKLFRLLRINRLFLHIKRVMLLVEETLQIRIGDGFTKLMRLGVGALVLAHWIGCFVRTVHLPACASLAVDCVSNLSFVCDMSIRSELPPREVARFPVRQLGRLLWT